MLRSHFRADGSPKRPMSEAEARRQAAIFGQQPYRCDLCERWHCGTVRP